MNNFFKSLFHKRKAPISYPIPNIDESMMSEETRIAFKNFMELCQISEAKKKEKNDFSQIVDDSIYRYLNKNKDLMNKFQQSQATEYKKD